MNPIALIILAAGFAFSAHAEQETYVIDSNHTFPNFSYNHLGYSVQMSRFDSTSGKIVLDRAAKTGTVEIVIDTTSVNTGSKTFNEHIQAEEFLDTKRYPKATFKSSNIQFDANRLEKVVGDLTLKGITKPVILNITSFHCMPHPMKKKEACGANATAVVKRSDFNMGKHAPAVGDDVTLNISVEAIKE